MQSPCGIYDPVACRERDMIEGNGSSPSLLRYICKCIHSANQYLLSALYGDIVGNKNNNN